MTVTGGLETEHLNLIHFILCHQFETMNKKLVFKIRTQILLSIFLIAPSLRR